jgi:hypothetical protein
VESAARMRALVNSLPQDNQVVLEYLIDFIGRVAQHSATNFMHIQNLATVFGPNLLRPKDASAIEMMGHTSTICAIVELLIGRREEIFAVRVPSRVVGRVVSCCVTQRVGAHRTLRRNVRRECEQRRRRQTTPRDFMPRQI